MELNNQRGQTVVEYILLLSVAVSLVVTFYNSETFKKLFGDQGAVGIAYKSEAEWGYRHAYIFGRTDGEVNLPYSAANEHPSYWNTNRGETHFFGPSDPYQ